MCLGSPLSLAASEGGDLGEYLPSSRDYPPPPPHTHTIATLFGSPSDPSEAECSHLGRELTCSRSVCAIG